MVNQSIIEGLKQATAKGETLRQAMISFYNAGYPKQEIEEAAREFQKLRAEYPMQTQQKTEIKPIVIKKQENSAGKIQKLSQKISGYALPRKKSNLPIIIVLSLILFFLVMSLVELFVFKDEIIGFFNTLF